MDNRLIDDLVIVVARLIENKVCEVPYINTAGDRIKNAARNLEFSRVLEESQALAQAKYNQLKAEIEILLQDYPHLERTDGGR